MRWLPIVAVALLVAAPAVPAFKGKPAPLPGPVPAAELRGQLVAGLQAERARGVIFLRDGTGAVLRIAVSQATVSYSQAVPREVQRRKPAPGALLPGAEVLVTALVDASSGEWTASHIEILPRPKTNVAAKPQKQVQDEEDDESADDPLESAAANRRTA